MLPLICPLCAFCSNLNTLLLVSGELRIEIELIWNYVNDRRTYARTQEQEQVVKAETKKKKRI